MSTELEQLLSLDEAAEILGCSPTTMRWAARVGRLPAKRLGRDWVTTRESVIDYAVTTGMRRRKARVT